jgi:uncharacterized protein (TIGR03118 family)
MRRSIASLLGAFGLTLLLALPAAAGGAGYRVHRLVSDQPGHATFTDSNLVNGWGISAGPTTPWWVSDEGTDKSTLYQADGTAVPLVVDVPGGPTGTVYNGSNKFVVTHNGKSGPSLFLFATGAGKIKGWNLDVSLMKAFTVASRSGVDAVYTGLAINRFGGHPYLYAADFANGRVDVFNGSFERQHWAGAFRDPSLPDGYSPFGIQAIDGIVFVTYALQDEEEPDEEVIGAHLGYVDAYSAGGDLISRVASAGPLNAPWGVAWAPDHFGQFSGDLLIGNFGNGKIHAYRQTGGNWQLDGVLRKPNGNPVKIDGLWGIGFGNGAAAGPTNDLYFAAGPDDETHGLFGSITAH